MTTATFEETQGFGRWVYWVTLACAAAATVGVIAAACSLEDGQAGVQTVQAAILLLMMLVATNALWQVTRVLDSECYVRFGWLFRVMWKHIRYGEVRDIRPVEYRPFRDAGGWGVRLGRFEGERCRFYNARGDRGVLIETERRRYIIGSQEPEALARALVEAVDADRRKGY